MRTSAWSVALVASVLLWQSSPSAAQALTPLFPTSQLDSDAGCYSVRCFMRLGGIDGNTAVATNTGDGVAVHVRSAGAFWTVQQVFTNPDYRTPPRTDGYPTYEAFSPAVVSGDSILVVGTSSRYNFKDVVYGYLRSNGAWSHVQTFTLQRRAEFERVVVTGIAVAGDTALVSGVRVDESVVPQYFETQVDVFKREADGTFHRRAILKPPGGVGEFKDYQLAIDGKFAVIGDPAAERDSGRAYVYENRSWNWSLRKTLMAPVPQQDAQFAQNVAISGDIIAIAEPFVVNPSQPIVPGAVHTFQRSNGEWVATQRITGPTVPPESEAPTGFTFGSDVALSGNRLLIANGFNGDFSDSLPPFAYLYEGHTTWGLKAILPNNFYYVTSIFLSGATAIVSADDEAYGRPGFIYELPLLGSIPDGPPEHP